MGYIKNLKESFKYAIKDIADDYIPQISDAASNIYETARNFRADSTKSSGVKSILSGVSKLPIFNELNTFANSTFDAIKTGRIYGDVGMGFDDSFSLDSYSSLLVDEDYEGPEAGIDDDRSTSSWGSSNNDKPVVSNDAKFNAKVTYDVSKASTSSLMKTMINNHIDSKMFMSKHNADVMTGFTNANASLEMLNRFNNDIMKSYVEQSIKYYGDSMSVLNDIKKSLHYATDESSGMGGQHSTWIDMLNNGEYGSAFKDMTFRGGNRATGGMFSLMMSMLPMYISMYAMNPGQIWVEKIKEMLENKAGFKGLKKMSDSISQVGYHAANATEKMMYSDNKYLSNIASGIYVRDYADKNLKRGFKKGPVPWDMTSKTTLEVVIPGLLNKIATGITGIPASIYDMKDESWKSSEQIASEVKQRGPNTTNHALKLKRVLRSGLKVENEETYNEIVEQLTRSLLEKNLTLESLTKGGMGQNKQGYEKFLTLLGNIEGVDKLISKADFAKIIHTIDSYKHGKNTSGDYNEIVNSMRAYHKQTARYHKDLKEDSVERGYIHLINDLDGTMPTEVGGVGRRGNKKVKRMSKLFTGDNANESDYTKLRGLIAEAEKRGISPKDTQKILKAFSSKSSYSDADFEKYADHEVGMIDKIHQTTGSFMMNNEFMEKHFYNTKFFQKLTEGMATNIDNIIKNTISNPIDNYLSGKLGNDYKEIISQKINRTLTAAESKAVDSFTDEQFGDLNAEFAKIDSNMELSQKEKEKRKKELYAARMRGTISGLSNLMGEISFPEKDNATGESFLKKHKKTAGLLLAGTAGVMGGGAIWQLMKKIPAVALLSGGSLGFLAPVALAGLGLAGGIYAYKSGIIETIMGQAKDPEKRKEIMGKFFKNVLPSMGLGAVAGGLSATLISQLPVVGGLMGPILGATIGIGTAIYSWKNKLFENMFGKKEGEKEGEEKKKKGILSMIGAGVPGVVGALGLSTIANSVGLTSIGGLIGSPILLATAGIASSILLEKDNIKKRLFGEGAEEHSFVKNMGIWLFGDKENGKVGLLSRQFEKFGKYIDKAGENISGWFKDNIVDNIKLGFKPFTESMGNIGNKILTSVMGGWDKMSDKMKEAMDKGFFKALSVTFEEKVINPISNRLGRMFNWIFGVAGKIISAPFKWFAKGFSGTTGEEQRQNAEAEMDTVKESASQNRKEMEEEYKIKNKKDKRKYRSFWHNTELDENGFAIPTAKRSDFGEGGSIMKRFGRIFGKGGGESFFSQNNSLWGKLGLGDSNISSSGCGLMAMAMVVSYFKRSKINPKDLLSYAEKYKVKGDGIATGFFADVASAFNLDYEVFPARRVAPESLLSAIKSNNRIIALLSENYNGKSKHYVYLKDTKGNDIIFSDPAGKDNMHMNVHALHSYAREYIVFSSTETKGESIKTTKTTWEKIKSKFSRKPTSTEDIAKEESRIQNASGLNLEEDETKAMDKDSKTYTKGSGLFHMRHIDKTVDRMYAIIKKNHSNTVNSNKLSRVIKTQTNGVAYNLEYIKRLMVKHLGDLDNGEKPGTSGVDGKIKIKKYHPVLSFFSNLFGWGKDTVMGGIHGIAEAGKNIISGVTDILLAPVRPILDAVEGTVKFFTTTLPNLIKKPFEMIGKVAGDAISGIVKGFGEVKDAVFGIVGDMWGATKEVVKDVYAIGKGMLKTSFNFLTSLGLGVAKLGWNTFAESRIGQKIMDGVGSFIGGALKGGGGILGSIGGLFKTAKDALLPIQKVFVTGGKLEIIDKINSITAVGAVDIDAMRAVDNKTQAGKVLEGKEKQVNKSNGGKRTQIETKGANKTQNEISRDKEIKAEDKEQDIEDIEKDKDRKGMRGFLARFGIQTKGKGKKDDNTSNSSNPSGKGFWDMLKGNFLGFGGGLKRAGLGILGGLSKIGKGALALGTGALGLGALGKVGGSAMSFLGHHTPLKYIPGMEWAIGNSGDQIQEWTDGAAGMVTKNDTIANSLGVYSLDDAANAGYGMRASRFILNYKYGLNKAIANGLKDSFEESQQRLFKQLEKTLGSKSYKAILNKHGIVQTTKDDIKTWGTKAGKKAAANAVKNPGMIERGLQMLFSHPKVANLLSKHGMNKISSAALRELSEKAVKAGAKKSSIIALRTAANFIPFANIVVAVGFFVWDYSTGFWNAADYFKVKKEDVTPKMRQISGMIKALQGLIASTGILFLVGLIPLEWLLEWTKKWFFSESERSEMDRSRERRIEEDKRKMIANIKDPTARAKAQQEYTQEQQDVYNTLLMKKTPKNGSYFTRDELSGKEEEAVNTIKLENAIRATKATGDSAVAMRTFWDSEITNGREGREKDRKRPWYKLGGWDKKGLAEDYAAMQMFTKNSEAMLELNRTQAMKYTFANGYTYQEVGCIPSSLADIYRSLGYEPNEMEMAMTADYYANYLNGGAGLPVAYAVDMAVLDGFGVTPLTRSADIDAQLANGNRVLMLTKYNGSNHAIAIVGKTDEGRYMVYDKLRSSGPIYMDPTDPAFKAMTSAIAIGNSNGKEFEYKLYKYAYIKMMNPNMDINTVGKFANISAMMEAKAWAKTKIRNKEINKPKDFNSVDNLIENKYAEFGKPAGMTKTTFKSIMIRDLFNDMKGKANNISFGRVKTKDGKYMYGNFETGKNGVVISGGKATLITSDSKSKNIEIDMSYYGTEKKTSWGKRSLIDTLLGNNKTFERYDKSNDFVISGLGKDILTNFGAKSNTGYVLSGIDINSGLRQTSKQKDIKLKDGLGDVAQGPIDIARRNAILNQKLNFNKALDERFKNITSLSRSSSIQQNNGSYPSHQIIKSEIKEIIKTDKVENLLENMLKALIALVELQKVNISSNQSVAPAHIPSMGSNNSPDVYISAINDILSGNV